MGPRDKLMGQVDPGSLDWKPATGSNWMTVGQLLQHLTNACETPGQGADHRGLGFAQRREI